MKKIRVFLVTVSLLLFFTGFALPQSGTTGAIEGKVTDDEGNRLPGVEVTITSPDLIGGPKVNITNSEGKYRFAALPRGEYTLEASLPGFVPDKVEEIKLFVGQTITVDLRLKIGTLSEEVTVRATAPLVDVRDSQINATNLDVQMLQTVGGEMRWKDSTALINMAPGVSDESAMGAPASVSNQWQIDGQSLMTFIGTGGDWASPDINIIEEVQVSGSGANAESGGFSGAIFNVITKSGGNAYEGMAEFSYSPLAWNFKNFDKTVPLFSLYEDPPRNLYFDAHLGIGGPIIKDKIWFYISGGFQQGDEEIIGFDKRQSRQISKGFSKLTFQLSENDRLTAYAELEFWQVFNRGLSVNRPEEATYYDVGPGIPASLNLLHSFSENTYADIKLGYYYSWYDKRPENGKDVSEHLDWLTGKYSGNHYRWQESESNHFTASASISHHADDFLAGSHDFKAGVEFLKGFDNSRYDYTGGYRYVDNYYWWSYYYYDYRYITFAYSYSWDLKSNGHKTSAFIQDSWKVSDRLTLNPGFRWTMMRGFLPNMQDSAVFTPKSAIEFRFGFSFDVFGDRTTALKAHYGRFHETFKTYNFNAADPGIEDWVIYELLNDGTKYEIYRETYSGFTEIDPNIRIPYSDQFTLGLERTLMKDTTLTLNLTHRIYKNFIAQINTGAEWELYPWSYTDENDQTQTIDVYWKLPGYSDQYLITNPEEGQSSSVINTPKNTYTGFSVVLNKRYSDGWMFHIDYTYSVSKGNHPNTWTGGTWGGTYYSNPNNQINAYGYLPYDAPHALNIYGTVALPWNFSLTPRFSLQSGWNWTRNINGPGWAGRPSLLLEERGSNRLPTYASFDMRLEKQFVLTDRMKIGFLLDAFNIFNTGIETWLGTNINSSYYHKATSVSDPRYFRIGFRFFF